MIDPKHQIKERKKIAPRVKKPKADIYGFYCGGEPQQMGEFCKQRGKSRKKR